MNELLKGLPTETILRGQLSSAMVQEMEDGGMGSLCFTSINSGRSAREVSEVEAKDEDGIPLLISLNLDQFGDLYELDIWKVNYQPLLRLPTPAELKHA